MAWKIQFTETRPSTSVNFYVASDEIKNHIKTTYRDTGKMTFRNSVFSGDNLQRVRTLIFSDKESWEEFDNDDVISDNGGRLSHNTSNNIELKHNFNWRRVIS